MGHCTYVSGQLIHSYLLVLPFAQAALNTCSIPSTVLSMGHVEPANIL